MINVNKLATLCSLLPLSVALPTQAYAAPPPCDINGQICSLDVCSAPSANLTCDPGAKACHAFCGIAGGQNKDVPPVLQNTLAGLQSIKIKPGTEVNAITSMLLFLKRGVEKGEIKASPVDGRGFVTFLINDGELKLKDIRPYGEGKEQPPIRVEKDYIVILYNISQTDVVVLHEISDDKIPELVRTTSNRSGSR